MADNKRESIEDQLDEAREAKKHSELTVKVNADFSDMLTGLKAVERQAKAAKRAVAELEQSENIYFETDMRELLEKWWKTRDSEKEMTRESPESIIEQLQKYSETRDMTYWAIFNHTEMDGPYAPRYGKDTTFIIRLTDKSGDADE